MYYYLPLYWCIAGLLELMSKFMKFLIQLKIVEKVIDYKKREERYIQYPTKILLGFNNRTCAIRIPRKPSEDHLNFRIEH